MSNGYDLNKDVDLRTMTPNQRAHYDRNVHFQRCLIDADYAAKNRPGNAQADGNAFLGFLGALVGAFGGYIVGASMWGRPAGAGLLILGLIIGGTIGSCIGND